ncbi:hypothetical protein CAEBREN_14437 [Caenorhabditis brenneri]|uniref:Uncharacterized protein n=1 Tax=Caenorhabditis brenneri TaxID=135651 RepID=G0PNT2_CAEBE|nr:hypothetical protein CAEBREN_14437 [Caenorhabditis brenneri]
MADLFAKFESHYAQYPTDNWSSIDMNPINLDNAPDTYQIESPRGSSQTASHFMKELNQLTYLTRIDNDRSGLFRIVLVLRDFVKCA